jgi:adenosylcobinamide-GDP ribazoletransferase
VIKLFARFVAAIRFLTLFPFPGKLGHDSSDLAGSIPFFPVVGLGLGCIAAVFAWLLWLLLPPLVAAVLLTLILLGFSGGLHLDGLADTADGFFSARSRAQILEIMRDSRIGAMGVVALVLALFLKIAALSSLSQADALRAALLMPLAGRCGIVVIMALLPYARPEGGIGTLFYTRRSRQAGLWGLLFVSFFSWLLIGAHCWLPIVFFLTGTGLFSLLCKRVIGGATGDTLGAACELSEAGMALAFSALFWSD